MRDDVSGTNHLDYKDIAAVKKTEKVAQVFHSVAEKYDLMNDIMSFGIHRLWKRFTIDCSGVRHGQKILDIAGGTGDLAFKFSRIVGEQGEVILTDINYSMLDIGRNKLRNKGAIGNIYYIQADAEELPFPDNYFSCVSIAFGLRNITNQNKALSSMYRVLHPGGRLLVLEFSRPSCEPLKSAYNFYSFYVLPKIGQLVSNNYESYLYLAESIRLHPDQETMKSMIKQVGFENIEYFNLTGGIVSLHRGYKF
ncbi:bifunctional demethylmenaquinone methyltransferase/2-methoxy-6-polyprenyl-1,4-benzoquinol methylase UbiE [Candidatus Profftia tarda]